MLDGLFAKAKKTANRKQLSSTFFLDSQHHIEIARVIWKESFNRKISECRSLIFLKIFLMKEQTIERWTTVLKFAINPISLVLHLKVWENTEFN